MKTIFFNIISIFVFMLFFTLKVNALTLEEANSQLNDVDNKLIIVDYQISSLEDDISIYGKDYKENNIYKITNNSFSNNDNYNYYSTSTNSFLKNKSNKTLGVLLEEKKKELNNLTKEKDYLNEVIKKLEKIELLTFDPLDVTKISNMSVDDVSAILSGTALEPLAQDFIDAEEEYGVNAIFIISICALESGWGTSERAVNDNNLTGLGVYSDTSKGLNSSTKRDNILLTTKILHNNYLTEGAKCYNGLSVAAVNKKYCVTDTWTGKITRIGNNLYQELLELYEIK